MNILFSLDPWEIRETTDYVWVSHMECRQDPNARVDGYDYIYSWFVEERPVCAFCGVKVPDEVQALILLYDVM